MILSNSVAEEILLAEHVTRSKFKTATSLSEIKDDPSFDAWEFEPCKCELRTDGSSMQLIIEPARGIVMKLCGTDKELVIDWEHVISGEAKDEDIFCFQYQRPDKPLKIVNFTSSQNWLMEDIFNMCK